ncbi:BLUF domain-containing protein [Cognatishimia maritima]|uniref:Sensors of blue-light using FAD n=1 Tax=Cognatishimia maritima TaxID=870908 RepID=A0A1M5UA83_9RHOB|nr:BLUF domain-containing protein [Cognatishimia maritima]SHH59904.1 Sensors of blue-light using FAD [Cognatishimia maritima]
MFYRIIYMSTANGNPEQAELEALMQRARRNNERDGITGLVAYHDFTFIQVLEGPEDNVRACFDRIRDSKLHRNIILVYEAHTGARLFDRYAMAFVPSADRNRPVNTAFTNLRNLFDGDIGKRLETDVAAEGFLRAFYDTMRGL